VSAADLVIASNRGPVSFRRAVDGELTAVRGGGGLVSGLAGLSGEAHTVWVCAALSDTDREVATAAPGGRLDRAGHDTGGAVRMLPIDPATLDAAYNGIANSTLWYVHHGLGDPEHPPSYDATWRQDWSAYVEYNRAFAQALAAEAAPNARVLVQDYHLTLAPAMVRAERPDLRIGHFSHTPWASAPTFQELPHDVARDLLIGLLGAESVGFHSTRWARDFIDCCVAVLGATPGRAGVEYLGRETAVRVHPLGVDPAPLLARAGQPDVVGRRTEVATATGERQAIVRVDRTEPSKNIARGLEAFRDLLDRYPEHRERVVHVALEYPSRQDVADYRRYTTLVETLAAEVNDAYATEGWTPVLLSIQDDYARSLATLQSADVLLVNPVRDGMNLVAKEGAVLSTDAVLVLSTEAGAADELATSAVMIDPFDVAGTADALHAALTMPAAERERRHDDWLGAATAHPPAKWLADQLAELS
jgi:trehalose 6-phosphate synthase